MRNTLLALLAILLANLTFGQTNNNQKLIELGKVYKDFMFRNEPNKQVFKEINNGIQEDLNTATSFIVQTITTKNKLLSKQYLSRPDDNTLKQLYIFRAINLNLREENQLDNNNLIDSLSKSSIPTYELVDNYYGMLFTAIGNKNQPFDLSKVDFKLKDYNFRDETEKAIFFLRCMKDCNSVIWGYMNVAKPPNTQKALEHIKKYPKFNGQPYYQNTDFYFEDFQMKIFKNEAIQSYKSHYLNKYYETLLFHYICLIKEGASEKKKNDLLLGSILKEKKLYKYTKYKSTLEDIFKEQRSE
jgi:hypothetical protein